MQSKTDLYCDCDYLNRAADSPDLPIQFDERMNEFNFVHPSPGGGEGHLLIRHCPICGGKAPESKRASCFTSVTREESSRLFALVRGLKTLSEVFAALGEPDRQSDHGTMTVTPEKDGMPGTVEEFRTLEYTTLSDTANLSAKLRPDDRVAGITVYGMYIGEPAG
jgi:uncharacterized protein DUF6980